MLLALTVFNLLLFTLANPFHKYPFVFLLDVGNEELEKTNTEQIRISVPGGSVALRYPATGDGETIAHVRVSGIDFGTDLKATILDGGPGSKYVVLVFMGNAGVPYDAVITIETLSDGINDYKTQSNLGDQSEEDDPNNSAEESNDKKEDFQNPSQDVYVEKKNAELTQSSSNVYAYTQNDKINTAEYNGGKSYEAEGDIHNQYDSDGLDDNLQIKDNIETNEAESEEIHKVELYSSESENDEKIQDYEQHSSAAILDKSSESIDDSNEDTQIESQENNRAEYNEDAINNEDQEKIIEDEKEFDQMFNDEEIHDDDDKHKDSNNNDYDNDYNFAVES